METVKDLPIRLFYNLANRTFYIQIGDKILCKIPDMVATAIQSKEQIDITHIKDTKEISAN